MIFIKIPFWRTPSSLHRMHRLLMLYTNNQHRYIQQFRPFTATSAAFGQAKYAKYKSNLMTTKPKKKWQRVAESVAGTSLEEGSWRCSSCAHLNFPNRFKCKKCKKGVPTEEQVQAIRRVQWTCADCGILNYYDGDCRNCKSPKRVAESVAGISLEDGSWYCSNCDHLNFPNCTKCRKCENGVPTEKQLKAIHRVEWTCVVCGIQNHYDDCWKCKSPKRVTNSVAGTSLEDGSWFCSKCVYLNFPNRFKCQKCVNGKPTKEQLKAIRRIQWICAECGLKNHEDGDCWNCKSPKRVAESVAGTSLKDGSWFCSNCVHLNFPSRLKCRKCVNGVPTEEQLQAIRRVQWICAECGHLNHEDADCCHCKSPKRVAESVAGTSRPADGSWYCSICGLQNYEDGACWNCKSSKRVAESVAGTSLEDGSWYCSNCAHLNFPSRLKCRKCDIGVPTKKQLQAIRRVKWTCAVCDFQNHEDGNCWNCKSPKRAAESVAGTSLEDGSWYCSNCAHLNFLNRFKCQKCDIGVPTEVQLQAIRRILWSCAECGLQNNTDDDYCWHCKSPKRKAKSVAGTSLEDGSWYCSNCERLHQPEHEVCDRCNTAPTEDQLRVILEVLPPSTEDGSWHCSSCAHLNFPERFKCQKCENGVPTEEQLQAILRVQWTCAECGLQNHRDGDCRHCKSPKQMADSVAGTSLDDGSWFCSKCELLHPPEHKMCDRCDTAPTEDQLRVILELLRPSADEGSWRCSRCAHLNFPNHSWCQKCKIGTPSEEQLHAIRRIEWTCAKCGLQNHEDGDCRHCKSPKQVAESVAGTSLEDGCWYCFDCSCLNNPSNSECRRCSAEPTDKQLAAILAALPPSEADGSWYCSICAKFNFPSLHCCRKCGIGQPTEEQLQAILRVQWTCAECGLQNHFDGDCRICKAPRRVAKLVSGTSRPDGSWYCSNCEWLNYPNRKMCDRCNTTPTEEQLKVVLEALPPLIDDGSGSWHCSSSAHLNFPTQLNCQNCENGVPTEEQRQAILSLEWTCFKCGLQNHGDGDCRHCNSPKRVTESVVGTSLSDGSWYCPNCNRLNKPQYEQCLRCNTTPTKEQLAVLAGAMPPARRPDLHFAQPADGSWFCTECSHFNQSGLEECERCGAEIDRP